MATETDTPDRDVRKTSAEADKIIKETWNLEEGEEIPGDVNLRDHFERDDVEFAELISEFENEFECDFPDEEDDCPQTRDDIVTFVMEHGVTSE